MDSTIALEGLSETAKLEEQVHFRRDRHFSSASTESLRKFYDKETLVDKFKRATDPFSKFRHSSIGNMCTHKGSILVHVKSPASLVELDAEGGLVRSISFPHDYPCFDIGSIAMNDASIYFSCWIPPDSKVPHNALEDPQNHMLNPRYVLAFSRRTHELKEIGVVPYCPISMASDDTGLLAGYSFYRKRDTSSMLYSMTRTSEPVPGAWQARLGQLPPCMNPKGLTAVRWETTAIYEGWSFSLIPFMKSADGSVHYYDMNEKAMVGLTNPGAGMMWRDNTCREEEGFSRILILDDFWVRETLESTHKGLYEGKPGERLILEAARIGSEGLAARYQTRFSWNYKGLWCEPLPGNAIVLNWGDNRLQKLAISLNWHCS